MIRTDDYDDDNDFGEGDYEDDEYDDEDVSIAGEPRQD